MNIDGIAGEYPQEIKDALELESAYPLEAWLNLPESICGIEIKQITPKILLHLHGIDSPLFGIGEVRFDDVLAFLWICSPSFCYDAKVRDEFLKQAKKINPFDAVLEIQTFLEKTFIDADYDTRQNGKKSNATFIAYLCDNLAREYSFSIEQTMQTPMRQIYQLLSVISERCAATNGEEYVKIRQSEKMINEFILNRLKNESS
jgi:hypothetical protein